MKGCQSKVLPGNAHRPENISICNLPFLRKILLGLLHQNVCCENAQNELMDEYPRIGLKNKRPLTWLALVQFRSQWIKTKCWMDCQLKCQEQTPGICLQTVLYRVNKKHWVIIVIMCLFTWSKTEHGCKQDMPDCNHWIIYILCPAFSYTKTFPIHKPVTTDNGLKVSKMSCPKTQQQCAPFS